MTGWINLLITSMVTFLKQNGERDMTSEPSEGDPSCMGKPSARDDNRRLHQGLFYEVSLYIIICENICFMNDNL